MNDTMLEISQGIIVTQASSCPFCEVHRPLTDLAPEVTISTIKSAEDGWIAKGEGRISQGSCIRCGAIFESVAQAIPIQCAPFPCPSCDRVQDLKLKIQSIKTNKESFQFEVSIICKKCSKKKSLKKIFKKILEVIKVEVKPTGITIKTA